MNVPDKLRQVHAMVRRGPRVLMWRLGHELNRRGGYQRKHPIADWRKEDVQFVSPFAVPTRVVGEPEEGVDYFSWDRRPIPENWHRHPITGTEYPKPYWSKVNLGAQDVKWAWEPARFDWVIAACREVIPDSSRLLAGIRGWRDQNRPFEGVHWACGQETSFRMFALMIAATVMQLRNRAAAAEIRAMLPQHAERIASALNYALSQENNHGLSESVALFLAGHALPDHPQAATWRDSGKSEFIRQVFEQFTEDGWYAQHSHNYTRVALLDGLIALRVASFFNDPLPEEVKYRLEAAAKLLAGISINGVVPNYGANDGANVLPLHECCYGDFRPVIAAVLRATGYGSPFLPGPWDELSEWFGLPLTTGAFVPPHSSPEGGYYVIANGDWRAMIRCHTYTNRPSQADMLHVDLWHGELNVLRDGGTYSYNDPEKIGEFLKLTPAHNAVFVFDKEGKPVSQMQKLGQFMWSNITEAKLLEITENAFLGEQYGYRTKQGLVHRRAAILREEGLTIIDDLISTFPQSYGMNFRLGGEGWTLADGVATNGTYTIRFEGVPDLEVILLTPQDTNDLANAESTYYGRLDRTFALKLRWSGETSRLTTTVLTQ